MSPKLQVSFFSRSTSLLFFTLFFFTPFANSSACCFPPCFSHAYILVRLQELLAANDSAVKVICSTGNYFSGVQRAAYAQRAFDAYQEESPLVVACNRRPFDELFSIEEYRTALFPEMFVQTCAHLQSRVSLRWHAEMVRRVCEEFDFKDLEPNEEHAVFSELLVVVAWSMGIAAVCKSAGLSLSPLPPAPETAPPRRVPLSHFAAQVQLDTSVGFAPFITRVNPDHGLDRARMNEFAKGSLAPYVHVALAPEVTISWIEWFEHMYIPDSDVSKISKPCPASRCLSRPQIESVAIGVTEAVKCSF